MSPGFMIALNLVLGCMMFGIALSLTPADFKRVAVMPKAAAVGLVCQFILLPFVSYVITIAFKVPAEVALGLLLVGCCPGGTFSNIMTYLARGNAALSVSMTAVSSSVAAFATPANFLLYASLNPETAGLVTAIDVGVVGIVSFVFGVLIVPLILGLLVRHRWPALAARFETPFRRFSLVLLLSFALIALGSHWEQFAAGVTGYALLVILHNLVALSMGFGMATLARLDSADRRAVTLETGIQNSGLGLGIIFSFFPGYGEMAIIAGAWSIWHLTSGLALSSWWARRTNIELLKAGR
ncbi:bile acid:sodium symporter family protein [uncultured Umboniibacter sp.]|uniref:bile acid:sodium symporter family protein n=1 Tax=uncultured Umboniibacter sp. TaxID=1798917 RepID=UPI00260FACE7|nr:bile acid:sodium symporter family protein [uncultured Umboniibacter sp.]